MVRKQVPCRAPLEFVFHCCRLCNPCHVLCPSMGNPCADIAGTAFKRFVVRPVIFVVTTVPWGLLFDWFMLLLGPALICLATSIVGWCAPAPPSAPPRLPSLRHTPRCASPPLAAPGLTCIAALDHRVFYAGLYYVLPLKATHMGIMWWTHVSMALWLSFNILFNYYCCARTNPGTHDSPEYQKLIAEARAEGKIHEEGQAPSSSDEDTGGKGKHAAITPPHRDSWGHSLTDCL